MTLSPAHKSVKTRKGWFLVLMSLCFALATLQYLLAPLSRWADLNLAIAFIALYLVPGYIIYTLIFPRKALIFEIVPLSFCFSLTFVLLPLILLAYILSLRMQMMFGIYFACCFTLLIVFAILRTKHMPSIAEPIPAGNSLAAGMLLIAIIILATIAYFIGGFVSGDACVHIPLIRKYELPTMTFRNPYYKEYFGSQYAIATWHIAMAHLSAVARVDIINTYARIPFLLIPIYITALFSFAKALFQSDEIGYNCAFLFVFLVGILSFETVTMDRASAYYWELSLSPVQSFVARSAILTIALALSFDYLYTHRRRYLFLAFMLLATTATINLYYPLVYGFFMVSLLFTALIFDRTDRQFLRENVHLITAVLILIILYVLPSVLTFVAPIKNPFAIKMMECEEYRGVEGVCWGGYPCLNLARVLWADTPRKLAFILVPFLIFFRKNKWAQFLFGTSVFTLIICGNPLLLYVVKKADVTLTKVTRLGEFPLYILILGFFSSWFFNKIKARLRTIMGRQYPMSCLLLIMLFLLTISCPDWRVKSTRSDNETMTNRFCRELEQIKNAGIVNSLKPLVVLSDQYTSLFWIFYFPHYVVYGPYPILETYKMDPTSRMADLQLMLSPRADNRTTEMLLDHYMVDLIVVNKEETISSREKRDLGFSVEDSEQKFASQPGVYQKIYSGKDITIFKYIPRQVRSHHICGN